MLSFTLQERAHRGNRHVDQGRRVSNGVVLVLVMRLIGADGVIARPLAIIEALAQAQGAFVNGSPD